jgi:hypothetical protein
MAASGHSCQNGLDNVQYTDSAQSGSSRCFFPGGGSRLLLVKNVGEPDHGFYAVKPMPKVAVNGKTVLVENGEDPGLVDAGHYILWLATRQYWWRDQCECRGNRGAVMWLRR